MTIPFASRHSPSFPQLLAQVGASVVVSTYQAGQLILLRNQNGTLNTHFCALEKPMGVAANGQRLTVGTGFQVWEYANLPAVAPKVAAQYPHDACYLPRQVHVTGDIDIHEMAYAGDGELWLVNTRMSCLCSLDRAYSVVPRWRPPFVSAYDLTDRCHLNGVAMRDGLPAFVSALGETDEPAGWRANKASGGILMDVENNRILARGLSMPHSPRWHDGKLWFLESGAGTLSRLDPQTGAKETIAELPGFTRGLDFAGHYAFIGLSQVRETAVFAGLPLTARVADRQCGVWVVDTLRGEVVAIVSFTGSVQEIFSVQLLPWHQPAVLDMDDPLVRASYALPDAALSEVAPTDPLRVLLEQATAEHARGAPDAAIAKYRELLSRQPEHTAARYQLGVALVDMEHFDEAEGELMQALQAQPDHAQAWNSVGLCHASRGELDQALASYDKAIAADRQFAAAHFNRGLILLKLERYREAWPEYDWRWQMPSFTPFQCPQPLWNGEDIHDQTLLVHTEQGNGDAVQFARFLPLAAARCKKLVLVCTQSLRPLLASVEGVDEVRLPGSLPLDSFDVYCPLLTLPRVLDISLENLPAQVPYLAPPPQVSVPQLRGNGRLKVGLTWAGSATQAVNHHRSCPLEYFLTLAELPDIDFFSLQTPLTREDTEHLAAAGITNLEPELTDYGRTAALIEQMDLVITVCTSVAHVAGALGKPVWVLLAKNADWRWLRDRQDSPWYPSARLFRQRRQGDWAGVIAEVTAALSAKAKI